MVDRVLEALAGLELRRLRRRNLDGFPGARIASGRSGALGDAEIAEADDLHLGPGLQAARDRIEGGIHGLAGARLGHPGRFGDCCDQIVLVHELSLS